MNITEWKRLIYESRKKPAVPLMTNVGINMLGTTVREAVTNGRIQHAAIKSINDKYPLAAATLFMDLSVEAEAFGCPIIFKDYEIPVVAKPLAENVDAIISVEIPSLDAGRISQYLLASRLTADYINHKPVLAICTGPFTLAGLMWGTSEILSAIYTRTDAVLALLQKTKTFLQRYIKALKHTGADGIFIAEPTAALLSPADCQTYSSDFVKELVDAVQDEDFMVILHNCGNVDFILQSMINTGAGGFHLGTASNLALALREIPKDKLIFGNLDPSKVFEQGTNAMIFKSVETLFLTTQGYNNFVISSGCDIQFPTPIENIEAFFGAVEHFNNKQA
jgi:uroporphyrinogen decarboxylase